MAIIVDRSKRVLVQGITGREGRARSRLMREYGTNVVAGCTPGKGGGDVEGVPVFDTVGECVEQLVWCARVLAAAVVVLVMVVVGSIIAGPDAGEEGLPAVAIARRIRSVVGPARSTTAATLPGALSAAKRGWRLIRSTSGA